ncbi:MAG: holo-ACP synthase [Anaerolineae bacterium]|nr:holo-ACP synthase [Anaerolineae bacterium]
MNLRTGIDLVEISRFGDLREDLRARFIERVFTEAEITLCHGRDERLAGRFAVKEAVAKALGCGIGAVSWQEIEILRGEQGEPLLILHGKAQVLAEELGLVEWSVSISHTHLHAVGLAVGLGE